MDNHVQLRKFIHDFGLMRTDGVVIFPARITYHMNAHEKTRYTEVQVLLGDRLDTIYLLNPDLPFEDLPDTFMTSVSIFKYLEGDHLTVAAKDEPGVFVKIYPMVVKETTTGD
jgi:hypothetical protein